MRTSLILPQRSYLKKSPLSLAIFALIITIFLVDLIPGIDIVSWLGLYPNAPLKNTLSYAFVHANFIHIAANMLTHLALGPRVERDLGPMKFVIFSVVAAILSGAGALEIEIFLGNYIILVGYSGVLCAYAGVIITQSHKVRGRGFLDLWDIARENWVLTAFLILPLILPINISGEAHLIGFIFGYLWAKIAPHAV